MRFYHHLDILSDTLSPLFLFDTAHPSLFRTFNTLLVGFRLRVWVQAHEPASCLPWSLEVSDRRLPKQVYLDEVDLQSALQWNYALNEERVRVFEVEVHDAHHPNTRQLALPQRSKLGHVIRVNGGGDQLRFLGRAHWGGFDVFYRCHICI